MDEKEKHATATRGDIDVLLRTLKHHLSDYESHHMEYVRTLDKRVTALETYAKILAGGIAITVGGIAVLAFWFGGLRATVSNAAVKTDKVYEVVLENSDSLATRTKGIETKLENIDKNVTELSNQQRRK
jgi:hypothetical protein